MIWPPGKEANLGVGDAKPDGVGEPDGQDDAGQKRSCPPHTPTKKSPENKVLKTQAEPKNSSSTTEHNLNSKGSSAAEPKLNPVPKLPEFTATQFRQKQQQEQKQKLDLAMAKIAELEAKLKQSTQASAPASAPPADPLQTPPAKVMLAPSPPPSSTTSAPTTASPPNADVPGGEDQDENDDVDGGTEAEDMIVMPTGAKAT